MVLIFAIAAACMQRGLTYEQTDAVAAQIDLVLADTTGPLSAGDARDILNDAINAVLRY